MRAVASRIIAEAVREYQQGATLEPEVLPPDAEQLRWFPLPSEVLAELQGKPLPERPTNPIHVGF